MQVRRYSSDPFTDCAVNVNLTKPEGTIAGREHRVFLQEIQCSYKTAAKFLRLSVSDQPLYIADITAKGTQIQGMFSFHSD